MFDTSKEIEINIYSGGNKRVVVAWPADADWKRRANKIRTKQESAGRDRTKSSVIGAEPAALELLEKYRKDDGDGSDSFDAAEAVEIIDRLEYCEVEVGDDGEPGIDLRGDRAVIRIGALKHRGRPAFVGLVHVLRHPSMRQMRDYRNSCIDLFQVRRGTEMVQPLAPGESLYDALVERTEGYAGAVPVVHKDFVVMQLLGAIRELEDGGEPAP